MLQILIVHFLSYLLDAVERRVSARFRRHSPSSSLAKDEKFLAWCSIFTGCYSIGSLLNRKALFLKKTTAFRVTLTLVILRLRGVAAL
jgi:hypothetical protein